MTVILVGIAVLSIRGGGKSRRDVRVVQLRAGGGGALDHAPYASANAGPSRLRTPWSRTRVGTCPAGSPVRQRLRQLPARADAECLERAHHAPSRRGWAGASGTRAEGLRVTTSVSTGASQ